ncbi:MAG: hypothetical protein H7844_12130 [Nitrospirae bacterium YQR-1]
MMDSVFYHVHFGQFLVSRGFLTSDMLEGILRLQTEINVAFDLSVLQHEVLGSEKIKLAVDYQKTNGVSLHEALIALNLLDKDTIAEIEERLQENDVKFGELLVKKGIINEGEIKVLLEEYETGIKHKRFLNEVNLALFRKDVHSQRR